MTARDEEHNAGCSAPRCLGIELGSSRIKATLTGSDLQVLANGVATWENQLINGLWTYSLEAVWSGLQTALADLKSKLQAFDGSDLRSVEAIGISAMMHGYLAFDSDGQLLTGFRTWRNTNTGMAAAQLTKTLGVNMPLRWSVTHLFQAMLDDEPHVARLDYLTTLAGYVHWQLTGRKVLGIGDASGMFPVIDGNFDPAKVEAFDALAAPFDPPWQLGKVLPRVLLAGDEAGTLTSAGAALLDPTGQLAPCVLLAPPEGDAGTGMVATNTITPGCGNVSVGTSIFAMVVTTKPPTQPVPEIDVVATPDGHPVAMVHCNNGASELGSWSQLLADFTGYLGVKASIDQVFSAMMAAAVDGADDGGGWLAYNYLAGEPVVGTTFGWPLVVRLPEREAKFADFARAGLYGVFATLRIGMELLRSKGIQPERLLAHGGLFKTPVVAQRFLAAALNLPVTVGQAAGDGGSWGMAVLANYRLVSASGVSLSKFLAEKVMANAHFTTLNPEPADVAGFNAHLELYKSCLALERTIDLMERSQDR